MNLKFLLFLFTITGIVSCSTAYRSGQTPDDVYYSPVRTYDNDRDEKRDSTYTERERTASTDNSTPPTEVYRDYDPNRYPRRSRERRRRYYENTYGYPKKPVYTV